MNVSLDANASFSYAATIPAGQIGLWVSDASNNSFDNFKAHDLAGPFEVDGRWFSNSGDVQVDASNSNLISIGTASDKQVTIVRRGLRAGKYVMTYRFQWISGTRAGPLVRWVNPGDWIAVQLFHSDGKARLSKREADGNVTQLVTGTNSVSLTNNSWYTGRVVVGDDTGNSALQRLRFWVDTDGDGDFADETALLDTTTIDDVWSAGHVGLFRGSVSNAQDFDDFKAGIDANADLDIADAGDEIVVDDDFATNVISPAYDNNGNLTDDGINKHVYDGWNRHVKSTWRIKSPPSAVVAFEHDGSNRRVSKVVTNSGVENTANDGGNTTQEYLFANGRLVEERNGSNQLTRAYMWHDGQLVWFEANGDPSIGNDSNPDLTATGEGSESVADKRYFHVPDRTGFTAALTDYAVGGGTANGRVVERASRHNSVAVRFWGDDGGGERSCTLAHSRLGLPISQDGTPTAAAIRAVEGVGTLPTVDNGRCISQAQGMYFYCLYKYFNCIAGVSSLVADGASCRDQLLDCNRRVGMCYLGCVNSSTGEQWPWTPECLDPWSNGVPKSASVSSANASIARAGLSPVSSGSGGGFGTANIFELPPGDFGTLGSGAIGNSGGVSRGSRCRREAGRRRDGETELFPSFESCALADSSLYCETGQLFCNERSDGSATWSCGSCSGECRDVGQVCAIAIHEQPGGEMVNVCDCFGINR